SSVESHSNPSEPLPLFRPEAIAALQQKFHGEIILIRPFPLMLLCWFALGIITNAGQSQAAIYVPASLIARLHPGTQLSVRCGSCPAEFARQVGTVQEIPQSPLSPTEMSEANLNLAGTGNQIQFYKIKVSLPPQAAQTMQVNPSTQAGVRVEAEIPLGHKPLIKWFFERSGS